MSPAAHGFLRGTGQNALFGWPDMPKVEALRTAWIDATDAAQQQKPHLPGRSNSRRSRTCRTSRSAASSSPAPTAAT
jgi:hypothetical protein